MTEMQSCRCSPCPAAGRTCKFKLTHEKEQENQQEEVENVKWNKQRSNN